MKLVIVLFSLILCPLFARAEAVCVTTTRAHLRSGPSSKFPVAWTVAQHMPLMRLAQKGAWSQVKDFEGDTYWVNSSVLSSKMTCAVVRTKSAKLLKGPGPEFETAEFKVADKYTPFKKIDRDGPWLLVQDDYHGEFWINEDSVWIPMNHSQFTF